MQSNHKIKKKNILVVGDIMLDIYYMGHVNRISPEAPVPVFQKTGERSVAGGAANVAMNLIAAGQNVAVMAMCGNDMYGDMLLQKLESMQIDTSLIHKTERETITKTRFVASNHQQLMRMDIEDSSWITEQTEQAIVAKLYVYEGGFDAIIISDYMKGMLTAGLTQKVIAYAKEQAIPVLVDVKDPNAEKYSGAYLLKPNKKELKDLTGMPVATREDVVKASRELLRKSNCKYVLTTCGEKGMLLVDKDTDVLESSAAKEVYDVTGAGDTVIAYLTAGLVSQLSIRDAISLANKAAGLQVAKLGTSIVYLDEIYENKQSSPICYLAEYYNHKEEFKDKKIVFTNGCFDILHVGHIRYLEEAATLGDVLIVGLNSDSSVKRLKGENRPVNTELERAQLLSALKFVDYVVIFEEDTPYELIKEVQPDVLVKGGDYEIEDIVGRDIVMQKGGIVKVLPFVEGKSTTGILQKMKEE